MLVWLLPGDANCPGEHVLQRNREDNSQNGPGWSQLHHGAPRFCRWLPQCVGIRNSISAIPSRIWIHAAKDCTWVSWLLSCLPIIDRPFSHRKFRYTAYRQLVRWCWGFLGRHHRVPLPACAVARIRKEFPEDDGLYTGFAYPILP